MTDFKIGDRVFARVRSYPFWPARVEQLPHKHKKKQYKVIFYFTLQTGFIDQKSMEPFNDETIERFKPLCRNKNFFRESLEDALLEEAQEGIHIRSEEIRKLPLYEEPSKKKKFVVPIDQKKTSTNSSQSIPTNSQSSIQSEEVPASEVIKSPSLNSGTFSASKSPAGNEQRRSNSASRSNATFKNEQQAKLEPIIMPAPEDLFTLHLDLVRSLHWQKPNHPEALNVMNKIQRYLDWPALIKAVPGMVENLYKISNYTKNKQVQLKAIYLYNQMKWTLFCNREIDFIEKEFPV